MEITTITSVINESQGAVKSVLVERFSNNKSLSEIGKELGITKERVRQIENRILAKLVSGSGEKEIIDALLKITKDGATAGVETIKKAFKHRLEGDILLHLIKTKSIKDFYIEKSLNVVYKFANADIDNVIHAIKEMTTTQILPFINKKTKLAGIVLDQEKLNTLLNIGIILKLKDDQYIENPSTKRKALELWLATVGEAGFPIKKQLSSAKRQLSKLFPDLFLGQENIGALIENNDNILLKDWGLYVHIGHIGLAIKNWPQEKFEEIAVSTIKKEDVYNVEDFFIKNENELNEIGITSMHMLYEIARRTVDKDKLSFKHTPWVSNSGDEKKKVAEVVNDYARKIKGPFSAADLAQHLGVKTARAMQIISASKDIIKAGKNSYQIIP